MGWGWGWGWGWGGGLGWGWGLDFVKVRVKAVRLEGSLLFQGWVVGWVVWKNRE